jgi:hypothetical protein
MEFRTERTPVYHLEKHITLRLLTPLSDRLSCGGQHKPAFKLAFGSYGAAARALGVSRMTIWRWCHDQSGLPRWVAETIADVIQNKVLEVHDVQNHLRAFLAQPERPPRPLSGCCAGFHRRAKRMPPRSGPH